MTEQSQSQAMVANDDDGGRSIEIGPNWFASVMGTGIIANAAVGVPLISDHLHGFATAVWLVACVILIGLIIAVIRQWIVTPHLVRKHTGDPTMAQFFGAPPMALMTIAGGTLLVGEPIRGAALSIKSAWILWGLGTLGGLGTATLLY